jgi:hypothetical protein
MIFIQYTRHITTNTQILWRGETVMRQTNNRYIGVYFRIINGNMFGDDAYGLRRWKVYKAELFGITKIVLV